MNSNINKTINKRINKRKSDKKSNKVKETNILCDNLNFAANEAYKRLRTNILFSFADGATSRIVGITSSIRGEGKSFTSINIAYTMAQSDKKVILIDADLRIPTAAKKLNLSRTPGLSNILVGDTVEGAIQRVEFENSDISFDFLAAGELPPNPAELLASKRMELLLEALKKQYDFIIVDLPPVCVVADGIIFSKFADGMMLVVRQDYCRTDTLNEAVSQLKFAEANIIGFVYNAASSGQKSYGKHGKYGKYYNKYYGTEYSNPNSYEVD